MGNDHELIIPLATFAPWNSDNSFQDTYKKVSKHTLVDKYRCYELWSLIEQSAKLSEGSIIEIGVWRGGTGAIIAKGALECGLECPVYLCDTFNGIVKAGAKDPSYLDGDLNDTSKEIAADLIFNQMGLNNVQILEGIFPDETAQGLAGEKFRFAHIDVDVYNSAKGIADWIWDKMIIGGIIVYDDYGFYPTPGITRFVDEQRSYKDRLVLHNLNGHGIVVKLGERR